MATYIEFTLATGEKRQLSSDINGLDRLREGTGPFAEDWIRLDGGVLINRSLIVEARQVEDD